MVKDYPSWIDNPDDPRHVAITSDDLDKMHPEIADYLHKTIMALHKANDATQKAKTTDAKTGVANEEGLREGLQRTVGQQNKANRRDPEKAQHLSIVFIDANDFGLINKKIADRVGDETIIGVAGYFRDHLRGDDFVARKGGDEFIVVMNSPEKEAKEKMQALKDGYQKDVTAVIQAKTEEFFPDDHKEKISALQMGLAQKHKNPALKNKPFEMTFSFGVKELSSKQIDAIRIGENSNDVISGILSQGDELMRDDKAQHIAAMKSYQDAASARINGNSPTTPPHR